MRDAFVGVCFVGVCFGGVTFVDEIFGVEGERCDGVCWFGVEETLLIGIGDGGKGFVVLCDDLLSLVVVLGVIDVTPFC